MATFEEKFAEHAKCIVDSHHGIYIPQVFITDFEGWKNIKEEDADILKDGPEHEYYWDAWDTVLQNAYFADGCTIWRLHQDADLFAIPEFIYQDDEDDEEEEEAKD